MYQIAKVIASNSSNCQDRVTVAQSWNETVIAVADGAGGCSGGAEAAQMAVDLVQAHSAQLKSPDDCAKLLRRIDQKTSADRVAGETTCVVVVVTQAGIFGASVGDSGAFVFNEDAHVDLTQFQVRKPFIGVGAAHPTSFAISCPWNTLLVASDGLLKYTSIDEIRKAALHPDLDTAANALVRLVRYPSGQLPDDVTIVLCRS